jgi:nuclear pore complex protein Nup133
MTFLNFSQLPESVFHLNFPGKHFPGKHISKYDWKCFPLTNFSNGKQTQKSLENGFPKSEFQKTNITIVNICCFFFFVLVVWLELPKMKRKYMDRETCLSWIICRNELFIWRHLSSSPSKDCVVLELPPNCVDAECHLGSCSIQG